MWCSAWCPVRHLDVDPASPNGASRACGAHSRIDLAEVSGRFDDGHSDGGRHDILFESIDHSRDEYGAGHLAQTEGIETGCGVVARLDVARRLGGLVATHLDEVDCKADKPGRTGAGCLCGVTRMVGSLLGFGWLDP
jgi:hypothetical protein